MAYEGRDPARTRQTRGRARGQAAGGLAVHFLIEGLPRSVFPTMGGSPLAV